MLKLIYEYPFIQLFREDAYIRIRGAAGVLRRHRRRDLKSPPPTRRPRTTSSTPRDYRDPYGSSTAVLHGADRPVTIRSVGRHGDDDDDDDDGESWSSIVCCLWRRRRGGAPADGLVSANDAEY